MFKKAISSLTSIVVGAVKDTARSYSPENGKSEKIAQYAISNEVYRSNILSEMAKNIFHNMQVESAKKEKLKSFIESSKSNDMRSSIVSKLGETASSKQIDKEMSRILDNISKSVDKNGIEETKKTDLFKEFGTYFNTYKNELNQNSSTENVGGNANDQILSKIESNTARTANTLNDLYKKQNTNFGGHDLINKIIESDGFKSIVEKTKTLFGITKNETQNNNSESVSNNEKITVKNNESQNNNSESVSNNEKITVKNNEISNISTTENTTESAKENEAAKNKRAEELKAVSEKILEELVDIKGIINNEPKKANAEAKDNKNSSLLDKAKEYIKGKADTPYKVGKLAGKSATKAIQAGKSVARYIPKAVEGMASAARGSSMASGMVSAARVAAPMLGTAALAATVGAGAYMAGKHIINPLIDKGLSAATGSETSLGSWIYDKMNPEKSDITKPTTLIKPTPTPPKAVSNINTLKAEKEKQEIAQSAARQQPIVIKGGDTKISGASSGSPSSPILSVRNQDSTFERVQMQDFWPRTP